MKRRGALSFRAVALGLAGLTALVAGLGAIAYFELLHYEPVAARHLPADSLAAARLDIEQGVLFEPVRKHLIPLAGYSSDPSVSPLDRVRRIEDATGLKRRDLREIVVARGPSWRDWVVVLGGVFPAGDPTQALAQALQAEGASGWEVAPQGDSLVHGPTGVAIGRASDGAVIVAASAERLALARPVQSPPPGLDLPVDAAGGVAIRGALLTDLADSVAWVPGLGALRHLDRVTARLELGDPVEVLVTAVPDAGTTAEQARDSVEHMLTALRMLARLGTGPDYGGERSVLERATVAASDGVARIRVTWERSEIDRAARSLAEAVRGWILQGSHDT